QFLFGIWRQPMRKAAEEGVEGAVDNGAELGAAGIGVEFLQRAQPEDMAGIDRIRIPQPDLDLSDRKLSRPRRARRARLGRREGPGFLRPVGPFSRTPARNLSPEPHLAH